MRAFLIMMTLTLAASAAPALAADADPVRAAVDEALANHKEESAAADSALLGALDKQIDRYAQSGDLDTVTSLQTLKRGFERSGVVPNDVPRAMILAQRRWQREREAADRKLGSAYDVAIEAYTRAKEIQKAVALRDEKQTALSRSAGKIPAGCIAYWSMDEATFFQKNGKTYVRNSIDDTCHLRLEGAKPTIGRFADALLFDGKSAYAVVEGNRSLDQYTIALWFRAESDYGSIFQDAHNAMDNSSGRPDVGIYKMTLFATGGYNGASYQDINSERKANDQRWHFAGLAVDSNTRTVTFVVDGKLIGSVKHYAEALHLHDGGKDTQRVELGARTRKARYFGGAIDEVMIFERVLSAAEMSALADR